MEHTHRDQCAIVGIGATDFSRASGRSELTPGDRRRRWPRWPTPGSPPPTSTGSSAATWTTSAATTSPTASASATSPTSARTVPVGRRRARWSARPSPPSCPGQATTVLVFRSLNGRSGVRFGQSPVEGARVGGAGSYDELFAPYGLLTPGQIFALMAQRHMLEFGTTPEQLGGIALACRARANANPLAQMHDRHADDGRLPRRRG